MSSQDCKVARLALRTAKGQRGSNSRLWLVIVKPDYSATLQVLITSVIRGKALSNLYRSLYSRAHRVLRLLRDALLHGLAVRLVNSPQ